MPCLKKKGSNLLIGCIKRNSKDKKCIWLSHLSWFSWDFLSWVYFPHPVWTNTMLYSHMWWIYRILIYYSNLLFYLTFLRGEHDMMYNTKFNTSTLKNSFMQPYSWPFLCTPCYISLYNYHLYALPPFESFTRCVFSSINIITKAQVKAAWKQTSRK